MAKSVEFVLATPPHVQVNLDTMQWYLISSIYPMHNQIQISLISEEIHTKVDTPFQLVININKTDSLH